MDIERIALKRSPGRGEHGKKGQSVTILNWRGRSYADDEDGENSASGEQRERPAAQPHPEATEAEEREFWRWTYDLARVRAVAGLCVHPPCGEPSAGGLTCGRAQCAAWLCDDDIVTPRIYRYLTEVRATRLREEAKAGSGGVGMGRWWGAVTVAAAVLLGGCVAVLLLFMGVAHGPLRWIVQ
jgi:hypothetical protein